MVVLFKRSAQMHPIHSVSKSKNRWIKLEEPAKFGQRLKDCKHRLIMETVDHPLSYRNQNVSDAASFTPCVGVRGLI
jgi:hypothetical protein